MKEFNLRQYLTEGRIHEEEQPTHRLLTDVYYVNGEFDDYEQEAVPKTELTKAGYDDEDISFLEAKRLIYIYMDEGTKGWYNSEEGTFESIEGSDSRVEANDVTEI